MAKICKVVDPLRSPASAQVLITDWSKCFLCQEDSTEALQCPAKSCRDTQGAGYSTIADLLNGFSAINSLPKTLNLSRLDDGEGIEATLKKHKAGWHDLCRLRYNKTQLRRAEKRKRPIDDGDSDAEASMRVSRRCSEDLHTSIGTCFFCGKPAPAGRSLNNASTFGVDIKVRQCAIKLQDEQLLAKLSSGDLIAQDAQYHVQCLASLYNKARNSETKKCHGFDADDLNHGIAFAELVSYIEDTCVDDLIAPVFKLKDLVNLYSTRLKQLGTDVSGRIHSTKLKDRLLGYFPDMEAHKQGREVVLISNKHIGSALRKACEHDADNDAFHLARAAKIVRRDMFKLKNQFVGSFERKCQEKSVPTSLLSLVAMVLCGPNIEVQSNSTALSQPVMTISQLLMHNSLVRSRKNRATSTVKHSQERETPLPIYLGVMLHTKTRKRELVDIMYQLGLSISYSRVLDISTELGNKICHHYHVTNAVCPPELKCGLFTTAAVDNIDHNPSSTSAHDAFHGTAQSLFQHPKKDNSGVPQLVVTHSNTATKGPIACLPETYTSIPPATLIKKDPPVPQLSGPNKADCRIISQAVEEEYRWLEHLKQVLDKGMDVLCEDQMMSWAAYHASQQIAPPDDSEVTLISMLPLFHDQAKSVAMIRHSMNIVKTAVEVLNPGQVPVLACDQPLYSLAKQIQWTWPESHGEKQFVIMFGGLHIEMVTLKVLGDLLEDSGWTGALTQAGVAGPGTADSFLKAAHVTRTRRAHQVTASSLYLLLQKAYAKYSEEGEVMSMEEWHTDRAAACPHFKFWSIILQLELALMIYVRAIREGNFQLYIESLTKIVPWFFALDHTHYSRWVPVHLRDMVTLKECHPNVYEEFVKGNFTVKKLKHAFSAIAIDHAHEQNNASVKGDGGAVGLTENPSALQRWMVSGPEMARLIGEFESSVMEKQDSDCRHHEHKRHTQVAFARDVKALSAAMEDMGNPFTEDSNDLLVLDSRNIADAAVADTVQQIEQIGLEQYEAYVNERLVNQRISISDAIKRNKLHLFSRPPVKGKSSKQQQISSLKNNCSLFSRLYIASQVRDGDLDEFFQHENQPCPPSLSQMGVLRGGTKSDLLSCLQDLTPVNVPHSPTGEVTCTILDGAAIVNMLPPRTAKTFQDYATNIFLPYITSQLQHVTRLDIVWDEYVSDSLKAGARSKRGKGVRRCVEPSSAVPGNWSAFLRIADNKSELFSYLATMAVGIDTSKQVISTHHVNVICKNWQDISSLAPCTHEEADTRMFLHLEDAVRNGHNKVSIRTVDTDVVVLAVASAQRLDLAELWIAFGVGKNFRFFAAHEIAKVLGPEKCNALPVFHAFTGCDTVSFFGGKGKKTAWDTWKAYKEVTPAFCALAARPTQQTVLECLGPLERFVILLYNRSSSQVCVNEARKQLFTQNGRTIEGLPPTQAVLTQHIKRAAYQAGYCWAQMVIKAPELPSPNEWGWKKTDEGWEAHWTTLPEAAQACRELIKCSCKKSCRGRCKCKKAALPCTSLCFCGGNCSD